MAPDVTSAPPPSTPTLSIETLIPAVSVVIDGTEYAIRSRKQLSIIESTQVASWGERLIALVTRALAGEDALTPEEEAISRQRHGLHLLHSRMTKPWRALRRKFLHKLHKQGKLVSPTAELEDHFQPEKQTWRSKEQVPNPKHQIPNKFQEDNIQ